MLERISLAALVLLLSSAAAPAQELRFSVPSSGVIYNASRGGLFPILGIPGASYLGQAYVSGVDTAAVSPDGRFAAVVKDGSVHRVGSLNSVPEWTLLEARGGKRLLGWTSDSSTVLVLDPASGILARYGADGTSTQVAIGAESGIGAAVAVMAAPGGRAVAITDGESGSSVLLILADGGTRVLGSAASRRHIALASGGASGLLVDTAAGQLIELRGLGGEPEMLRHPLPAELAAKFALAAMPAQGRVALVATGGSEPRMTRIDLESDAVSGQVALDSAPSAAAAVAGGGGLLLIEDSRQPGTIQLLDPSSQMRLFFVPPGPVTEG